MSACGFDCTFFLYRLEWRSEQGSAGLVVRQGFRTLTYTLSGLAANVIRDAGGADAAERCLPGSQSSAAAAAATAAKASAAAHDAATPTCHDGSTATWHDAATPTRHDGSTATSHDAATATWHEGATATWHDGSTTPHGTGGHCCCLYIMNRLSTTPCSDHALLFVLPRSSELVRNSQENLDVVL